MVSISWPQLCPYALLTWSCSNECKKRKLKCIPTGDDTCQRCIAGGIACVFGSRPQPQASKTARLANMKMHVLADASSHHHVRALTDEMAQLRQQVTDLAESVRELRENAEISRPQNTSCVAAAFATSPSNVGSRDNAPKHPHFIGPTRPAYGLVVAERSLTRMGIQAPDSAKSTSLSSSRADSPLAGEAMEDDGSPATDAEFWASCTPDEVARLLAVFEEEVESVYPFVDTIELASRADQILRRIRNPDAADNQAHDRQQAPLSSLDVDMVKLAVATAVAVEAHGKTALSASIAESVEDRLSRISRSQVELKGIQLLTMLVRDSIWTSLLTLHAYVRHRASTTSTATTSFLRGVPLASLPEKPSKWACTVAGASSTTSATPTRVAMQCVCFGVCTCLTVAGALGQACPLRSPTVISTLHCQSP